MSSKTAEDTINKICSKITSSNHVVALVGAGMSVESGIPTFRGSGGLWTKLGEPAMDGYTKFLADPEGYWRNLLTKPSDEAMSEFRLALDSAKPNSGHYALAELESMGVLKRIITQNVDGLHRIAGNQNVAEIHGNRNKLRCIECNLRWPKDDFPIIELPPLCPECNGLIKGDGVAFGEPIPKDVLQVCIEETEMCDCMLIIGTSALVHPAAGLPQEAHIRGASLIEINPESTPLTAICDYVARGQSGALLPAILEGIKSILNSDD